MNEYTYDDLIVNPNKEGIESLIGKEVYFSDIPNICLENANKNDISYFGTLERIRKDGNNPFMVKSILSTTYWSCIIPKKEEPKKYVPFETLDEFIESYKKAEERIDCSNIEGYIASCGMWLKDTDRDVYCLVTEIWNYGVVVGDSNMNTTKDGDEYFTFNGVTEWKKLFMEYTFLDGSPCGKEVEE